MSAGFVKSNQERPAQVYLTLTRKNEQQNGVAITSQGKLNKDTGLYEITLDVNKDIQMHFNGEYEAVVSVADHRAEKPL